MKRMKKTGIYKGSNVTYDPMRKIAKSYGWWTFLKEVNGVLLFNNHRYSMSTQRHQKKVLALLLNRSLVVVNSNLSLDNPEIERDVIKNAYFVEDFDLANKLEELFSIKFTDAEIYQIYQDKEEDICFKYLNGSFKREEKKYNKGLINIAIESAMLV